MHFSSGQTFCRRTGLFRRDAQRDGMKRLRKGCGFVHGVVAIQRGGGSGGSTPAVREKKGLCLRDEQEELRCNFFSRALGIARTPPNQDVIVTFGWTGIQKHRGTGTNSMGTTTGIARARGFLPLKRRHHRHTLFFFSSLFFFPQRVNTFCSFFVETRTPSSHHNHSNNGPRR